MAHLATSHPVRESRELGEQAPQIGSAVLSRCLFFSSHRSFTVGPSTVSCPVRGGVRETINNPVHKLPG
jgi:hypothetical protein